MTYVDRPNLGSRPKVARTWRVTVDPESRRRRQTFEVPVDGLIGFINGAFARGSSNVLLFDGKNTVLVSRFD